MPANAPAASSAAASAKKGAKRGPKKGSKHKKNSDDSYVLYIHKVLGQVAPGTRIKRAAMGVMDAIVRDVIDRLATEAASITRYMRTKTLATRYVQTTVLMQLPGELAKHAVAEGTKAITAFNSS